MVEMERSCSTFQVSRERLGDNRNALIVGVEHFAVASLCMRLVSLSGHGVRRLWTVAQESKLAVLGHTEPTLVSAVQVWSISFPSVRACADLYCC